MRQAQIAIFESDGRLAEKLRPLAAEKRWRLRELRQPASVLQVLHEGAPVLVVRIGRNVYEELSLLERAAWSFPETALVAVGSSEHPELAGLIWDLGASAVLFPPLTIAHLPEILNGFLNANDA